MARDFQLTFVRFVNNGAQFISRNVHINLERCCSVLRPEVNHAARIVRSSECMHHRCEGAASFEIWRGNMHLWTNHPAVVDQLLDFKICVWNNAAGGANGGNAKGKI